MFSLIFLFFAMSGPRSFRCTDVESKMKEKYKSCISISKVCCRYPTSVQSYETVFLQRFFKIVFFFFRRFIFIYYVVRVLCTLHGALSNYALNNFVLIFNVGFVFLVFFLSLFSFDLLPFGLDCTHVHIIWLHIMQMFHWVSF